MRYYTHDKMAVVKKTRKYTGMAEEKGTFVHCPKWDNVDWYSHHEIQYVNFSKN